jgi:DNA-binding NarL/FixJ family response regulator
VSDNRTSVRGGTKVVVAANDPATRAGIRAALTNSRVDVCAEAGSERELMSAIDRHAPPLCLVHVGLDGGAFHAVAQIATFQPTVAVVLLTDAQTETEFLEAMRVGASGYVAGAIASDSLANVVDAVLRGETAIPRALIPALVDEYRARPSGRQSTIPGALGVELTSRESEVLECMRDGLSTREIAAQLVISEVTVRRHIGTALKKLSVDNRAEALELLQSA